MKHAAPVAGGRESDSTVAHDNFDRDCAFTFRQGILNSIMEIFQKREHLSIKKYYPDKER